MCKREWEINSHSPAYRTPDGDISIKLRNGDNVDLRFKGYEYTAVVNVANESGLSEGTVQSYRSIGSNEEPEIIVGQNVEFSFKNLFSIKRN